MQKIESVLAFHIIYGAENVLAMPWEAQGA